MQYYFIVSKATGNITSVVQRSSVPQDTNEVRFVLASGTILLPIYYKLLSGKSVVSLQEVLNY